MPVCKKIFLAIIAAAVLLCLPSCKNSGSDAADKLPELVVGSDEYAPYIYRGANDEYEGIDVEISKEVCRRIGMTPKYKMIKWNEKNSYLESGEIDCIMGSFSMNDREDDYLWAGPYYIGRQVAVVRSDSGIKTLAELEGKRVAVQSSTIPEKILLDNTSPRVPSVDRVYCFSTLSESFASLSKGYVDACCGHEEAFEFYMKNLPDVYNILDEPLMISQIGAAFAKNADKELVSKFDAALKEIKNDGTVEKIVKRFLSGDER